jgi:hypothetical protein
MTRGIRDPSLVQAPDARARRARLVRFGLISLIAALLLVVAWEIATIWIPAVNNGEAPPGMDHGFYVDRTRSWLEGDGFYRVRQLAGPYTIENGDALYPPPLILLMLPWVLGAPAFLWWLIPLAVTAVSLYRLRPPLWAWAILVAVLVYRRMLIAIVLGNPSIWAFAAILAGAAYGWPAVGALTKPVLAPFSLIGANRRSWWIGLIPVAMAAAVFAPMWPQYLQVLADARNDRDIWYVVGEVPIAIALTVVGLSRSTLPRRLREGLAFVVPGAPRGTASADDVPT